jgi:hypothetical protein
MSGASEAPTWTGRLDRAPDGSAIGHLTDAFGFQIVITGKRDPEAGGFILEGRPGEPPEAYRIAAIDGEKR